MFLKPLSGTNTDRGIKNIKVYVSEDIQSNTTYEAAISNSTLVYNGSIDEHTAVNEEDPQSITIGVYKGTVSISSSVSAQELEFDVMSASTNITSNVAGILVSGDNEELSATSNINTSTNGDIYFGVGETLLSSSNNITTECDSILTMGFERILTSSNNITTECDSILIIGENELLSGNSNIIITTYSNLELELIVRGSSNIITDINVSLNTGDIEVLSGSLDGISNVYNSVLDIGFNETITGTSTTTSECDSDLTVV